MLWFVFYIVVLWFLLLKRRALRSTQRDEYNARLSFLLPLQGVISFCIHTQGDALGYKLLAFQAVLYILLYAICETEHPMTHLLSARLNIQ
jgi:hypothetical protein